MATTIRKAVFGDEERLARLNGFVQDRHLVVRPDHFKPTSLPDLIEWYHTLLERQGARVWIAELDGAPVGYVVAIVHQRTANPFSQPRRWSEIDQIAVDPSCRRQGIGRALLGTVIAGVRSEGIDDVEVTSWSFNQEAHRVFERLGFVPRTVCFELRHDDVSRSQPVPHSATGHLDSASPTFVVPDVEAASTWYASELGFRVTGRFPDTAPYSFAAVTRDGVEIMLLALAGYRKPDLTTARPEGVWEAYIRMRGVRAFYETVRDRPFIHRPLSKQFYGDWEFEVRDPNGYVLVFSELID